jgi:hypothetical protein
MAKTDLLQEGLYRGVVQEWDLHEAPMNLQPHVGFWVLLTHRATAGGGWDELPVEVVRSLWVILTPESMGLALAELRQLGFDDNDIRKLDPDHEEPHDFEGTEVEVRLVTQVFEDGKGNEIRGEWLVLPHRRPTDGRRADGVRE